MRTRTRLPEAIEMHEDVGIPARDGTRLSARIWRPVSAVDCPVPAILEHLPYRKRDGTVERDCLTHPWFAGHGYAAIRVDMRGNGDSDGLMVDEYTATEWEDACDVIAWVRSQPWCSGEAGMMGISWGGFNALQVAALRPAGLKAIVTLCSTADRYAEDVHYKGGGLLTENLGWAAQMLAYSSRPPDPEVVGDRWRAMWLHRLANQPFHLTEWLRHQRRDGYWRHGSVCEDYGAIEAAVLAVGGWHDGYRNTVADLVANLDAPAKGIVGPWIHMYPHIAGPEPAIGFLQEALRWWDRWLKGRDTGVEADPAMRLYLMDGIAPRRRLPRRPGRWVAEPRWPAPGIATRTLHLTDAGLGPDPGRLSREVSSPATCGATCGEYFPATFGPELPADQRPDDALSACFDAAPSTEAADIVGAPRVRLRIACDMPFGQVAVRLCDVSPDGASALISLGILNLSRRNGPDRSDPLTPGEPVEFVLDLDQTAYRLPAGHRLRLAVSSAYWPFLWPSPDRTRLTLGKGRLDLHIRPAAAGPEWAFEPPEGASPWQAEVLRPGGYTRRDETDPATGASVTVITRDEGRVRDSEHGLETSAACEERWSILGDDPASARGDIRWETSMSRGGWSVRTQCDSSLACDRDTFHLSARIRAWEGDALVFEKAFDERIPRDGV